MSIIPFIIMNKAGKSADNAVDLGIASLLASPVLLAGKIADKFEDFKKYIIHNAQTKANKKEYEEIIAQYRKLSEGKIGTVETLQNTEDNSTVTIVHTENGPFTRTTKSGNIVHSRSGDLFVDGTMVSYTGLREMTDENGERFLTFIDDVSIARSEPVNINHDTKIIYNTTGSVLTETGLKSDYTDTSSIFEGQSAPTGGVFDVLVALSHDFNEILTKAQNNTMSETNSEYEM